MTTYLLWFDNSKNPISVKIALAARRYQEKFGQRPNVCLLNKNQFYDQPIDGFEVKPSPYVLKNHFMVCRVNRAVDGSNSIKAEQLELL